MNKFHFSISIHFETDYDVGVLSKTLGLKNAKITNLKDSKGLKKSAKILYRTETFNAIYTDKMFANFVKSAEKNFLSLPKILKENNGTCVFRIVFENLAEKPCLSLDNQTINLLFSYGANFDIEFN